MRFLIKLKKMIETLKTKNLFLGFSKASKKIEQSFSMKKYQTNLLAKGNL